ncbi:MAG: hypothetical protein M3Y26_09325 [Actinomycetota bacterium]|nr:hypothetical protein [Actinomycetota bacterium]
MLFTDRPLITAILANSTALAVDLPRPVQAALTRHERLLNATLPTPSLLEAVVRAVEQGADPSTDPQVQAAATAHTLTASLIGHQLGEAGLPALVEAIGTHGDALVESWRPAFDRDAATLTRVCDALGGLDLTDTDSVARAGGDAADTWASATTANARTDASGAACRAIAALTRHVGMGGDTGANALALAALDLAQWQAVATGRRLEPWDLVRHGVTLDLATPSEYARRRANLTRQRTQEQQQAQARDTSSMKSPGFPEWVERTNAARAASVA